MQEHVSDPNIKFRMSTCLQKSMLLMLESVSALNDVVTDCRHVCCPVPLRQILLHLFYLENL